MSFVNERHSPEPWTYCPATTSLRGDSRLMAADGVQIGRTYDMDGTDAARICVCVNACKGLSNRRLEEMTDNLRSFSRTIHATDQDAALAALTRQRDELLAACEAVWTEYEPVDDEYTAAIDNEEDGWVAAQMPYPTLKLVRAAIASARVKQRWR